MSRPFASNIAPLALRLGLGLTFLWAGAAKLTQQMPVTDQNAAQLAEWGVITGGPIPAEQPEIQPPNMEAPDTDPPAADPSEVIDSVEDTLEDASESTEGMLDDAAEGASDLIEEATDTATEAGEDVGEMLDDAVEGVSDAVDETTDEAVEQAEDAVDDLIDALPGGGETPPAEDADPLPEDLSAQDRPASAVLVAAQPDRPETVRAVYGLALLINKSANPQPTDTNPSPMPLWPAALAGGKLPVYFAWAAAITESLAGVAVLFGFFTRLASLPLAGTMAVAMWLTQIGPAIQTGDNILGFLPVGMFAFDAAGKYVYTGILWQFALLLMAFALLCTGPGFLSLDRLLFGPPKHAKKSSKNAAPEPDVELIPIGTRQARRPQQPANTNSDDSLDDSIDED